MRLITFSAICNVVLASVLVAVSLFGTSSHRVGAGISITRGTSSLPANVRTANTFRAPAALRTFSPFHAPQKFASPQQDSLNVRPVSVNAGFMPPPVADTVSAFHSRFKYPLPMLFASYISRLITEQHFVRWNRKYQYNPVFALGVCSVFDQVFESLEDEKKKELFEAFILALQESPETYRADQAALEEWAKTKSASDIKPDPSGGSVEQVLAEVSAQSDNFLYNKFFSIGLFRMLELTGAKDPKALESLVTSLNLRMDPVIRDLNYYKSSLSALIQAQELRREAEARAQKKREEAAAKKTEAIQKLANKKL
mmetsp:Transcript_16466/g.22998  ORF Transcript_16466/g.22998 Transcript_16466/m.22998 type:complete len:312 (-) Transcript_16466:474-1409(-)|eukprot:CAMPEP_0184487210 /NCGR_PEP_ID=MMETSP0113_2-20130426/9483_1 /TAXON_ID=91329 /ORGANISM="Norrisiella sphaerica, Strain BC52" /LENGTH=311 /DNA_ID=CAMNT_0026869425 /DNA_START=93 /DNA_END=1028 /DNA_ORIENTATION=+